MLATLGGQPQVITFALDFLLDRGEVITEVIVLHLSGPRINQALARVSAEFTGDQYRGQPCRLRMMPLRAGDERLHDIQSEADAQAAHTMLRDVMASLKRERQRLHICVGGGRRIMALLLMSAAMFQGDYQDRLWHIYTPDAIKEQARDGALMHVPPDAGMRLIAVPFAPMAMYFPGLRDLTQPTPAPLIDSVTRTRCEEVINALTPRELEVLRVLAAGHRPQEAARELSISINTLETHKRKLFELCRAAWPDQDTVRYHHLADWFGPYFAHTD